jgi:2TM domain
MVEVSHREFAGRETSSAAALSETTARNMAVKRLQCKRKVIGDAVAYVVINAFLIVVWAINDRSYFWPGWVLAGWGTLLLLDIWNAFFRKQITEADIERELGARR